MKKEMKKLMKRVQDNGWDYRRRRSGHYVIEGPKGQRVYCSGTASDHRAIKNIKKDLAKAGLELE